MEFIFRKFIGHILAVILFIIFIYWNGGIVLGFEHIKQTHIIFFYFYRT